MPSRRDLKFNRLYNSLMRMDTELNRCLTNLRPELETLGHHQEFLRMHGVVSLMITETRQALRSFYDDHRDPHTPSTPI